MEQILLSLSKDDLTSTIKDCLNEVLEDRQPEFVRINEAAQILGVTRSALYGLITRQKIPYCKIGKYLYFSRYDLDSWIRSGEMVSVEDLSSR